ncbi:uncharacterized protein METZ01_LOCUS470998, partial [marine metagenome]
MPSLDFEKVGLELGKLDEINRQLQAAKRQKLALECKTEFLKFI